MDYSVSSNERKTIYAAFPSYTNTATNNEEPKVIIIYSEVDYESTIYSQELDNSLNNDVIVYSKVADSACSNF